MVKAPAKSKKELEEDERAEQREEAKRKAKERTKRALEDDDNKDIPEAEQTAIYRNPDTIVLDEPPPPPPIDPEWDPPPPAPPAEEYHHSPGAISPYSSGDSEQYGTEFPARLIALGPEGTEGTSQLLGMTDEPKLEPYERTVPDEEATAINFRKSKPDEGPQGGPAPEPPEEGEQPDAPAKKKPAELGRT